MEVNKENVEFIKRKLVDYGYYTKAIEKCEAKLLDLRDRIQDCYKASGVSYDEMLNSSNPNYSRVVELINEEYGEVLNKEEFIKKRDSLGLNDLLQMLTKEQYELIDLHFFQGYSQGFIAINKQYAYRERVTKKIKKTVIFLVKKY